MRQFDHDRLDVYQMAIRFVVVAKEIVAELPRGSGHVVDQLQRASTSIPLNVAEGAGEFCRGEKARFYRMARRSATECAAILDVCRVLEILTEERYSTSREILLNIVCMLVALVKKLQSSQARARAGAEAS